MNKSIMLASTMLLVLPAAPLWAQDHQGHDAHPAPATPPSPQPAHRDHGAHGAHADHAGQTDPSAPQHAGAVISRLTDAGPAFCYPRQPDGAVDLANGIGCIASPAFAEASGTARLPGEEGAMHGAHLAAGEWMVMAHGFAQLTAIDQRSLRGDDKRYVASMAMLSGERQTGWGRVQLRAMMSLEPLMDARGYPNLFATGETAGGQALIDRQHPHDLFMELAARVDINAGQNGTVFLYGGPVGEPALGPSAFMHRRSARYNPEAPITHHWFDATHITYGVLTAGYGSRQFQIEASAFRGAEPDEDRWDIETPRLDSWSVRATWTPTPAWAMQLSHGRLSQPEALHPDQDEARTTASVHYARGGLSAMLAFSNKDRLPGPALTAWLAEANWDVSDHHSLFARIENVANDELFPDHDDPRHEQIFRVTKLQGGYAYRIPLTDDWNLALGGSLSRFLTPSSLDAAYGERPWGYTLFARLSLGL